MCMRRQIVARSAPPRMQECPPVHSHYFAYRSVQHYNARMNPDSGQSLPPPRQPVSRQVRAAARYIDELASKGRSSFTLADLCATTGLSHKAARDQIARLDNKAVRVSPRKDFFVIVRPEQRAMGAPPASWWLDAFFRQEGCPYYIGLLSAAAEFGSQHQAVQEVQVVTDRPMRELTIGRQRLKFFVKRDTVQTPTTTPENAFAPVAVSTPAATALDLLRYADRSGGTGRAVEAISGMARHFDRDDVTRSVNAEPETATLQRFGHLLLQLNKPSLAKYVAAALPGRLERVWFDLSEKQVWTDRRDEWTIDPMFSVIESRSLRADA